LLVLLAVAALTVGCESRDAISRYETLIGTVVTRDADTGELTVRTPAPRGAASSHRSDLCVVTEDTEIYLNDKFSLIGAIAVGDIVELIGYRDPHPRPERFVVSFAVVNRDEPAPAPPDLSLPAAGGGSTPGEE
jgi:hypothetical protein